MRERLPLVMGNWKMNPVSASDALALATGVRDATRALAGVEVGVAPPYVWVPAVCDFLRGSHVAVGAQDLHEREDGAYTGGVSAAMLRGLVRYAIVGHSEVRRERGDTDARVNAKLKRALAAGILPLLCVGEPLEVRSAGDAAAFVRAQVRAAFADVSASDAARVVIAYEPIWAIGTGVPATGPAARETVAAVRAELLDRYDRELAQTARVLYGGSVTADTIDEFARQSGIDGALVGGASLRAADFARIAELVAEARR